MYHVYNPVTLQIDTRYIYKCESKCAIWMKFLPP